MKSQVVQLHGAHVRLEHIPRPRDFDHCRLRGGNQSRNCPSPCLRPLPLRIWPPRGIPKPTPAARKNTEEVDHTTCLSCEEENNIHIILESLPFGVSIGCLENGLLEGLGGRQNGGCLWPIPSSTRSLWDRPIDILFRRSGMDERPYNPPVGVNGILGRNVIPQSKLEVAVFMVLSKTAWRQPFS